MPANPRSKADEDPRGQREIERERVVKRNRTKGRGPTRLSSRSG